MEGIKLSLLIVSLRERRELLNRLLSVLYPQLTDQVELLICTTGKGETTGSKRNRLLASACGKYTCFIDDDDLVAEDYVQQILSSMQGEPDCIGFEGTIQTPSHKIHRVRYTVANRDKMGRFNGVFECFVGHITPIRSDILKSLRFPDKTFGEDSEFCKLLMPMCHTERFINKPMYHYFVRMEV